MRHVYDLAVVGAGPAGLIAAQALSDLDVLVLEKGSRLNRRTCPMTNTCLGCSRCGEAEGVGGAGGWSDGKLCLAPVGILDTYIGPAYAAEAARVARVFTQVLGYPDDLPSLAVEHYTAFNDMSEEVTPVIHLGTSAIRLAFQRMYESVCAGGSEVRTNECVVDIVDLDDSFLLETRSGQSVAAQNVIVATGKCDARLVPRLIDQLGLETTPNEPTIGVRISLPNEEMRRIEALGKNPKLRLRLPTGDAVKTHCFCFGGEVLAYLCGNQPLVGGRADDAELSAFSNVNLLYEFSSRPFDGQAIARDVLESIRATYPNTVVHQDMQSFLRDDLVPIEGDGQQCRGSRLGPLGPHFPSDVRQALQRFVVEVADLYAVDLSRARVFGPATEWVNNRICTSLHMETSRPRLYVVGDGSGTTQGIVSAAVTGLRAADSIRSSLRSRWSTLAKTCV